MRNKNLIAGNILLILSIINLIVYDLKVNKFILLDNFWIGYGFGSMFMATFVFIAFSLYLFERGKQR